MEMPDGWKYFHDLSEAGNQIHSIEITLNEDEMKNFKEAVFLMKEMAEALELLQDTEHMNTCGIKCRCDQTVLNKFKEWK